MPFTYTSSGDNWRHPKSWEGEWDDWYIVEKRKNTDQMFSLSNATIYVNGIELKQMSKPLEFAMSTEVMTGWRCWKIVDFNRRGNISEKRLQALGVKPIWEPYKPNVATCITNGTHEAPWPSCHCGFWAFHKRESVERTLFEEVGYGGEIGKVIGQVALWGRVLESTKGFRGEYAYPQTLQFVEIDDKIAKEVADTYGVPYSIVERSTHLSCEGKVMQTEWDFDKLWATVEYQCGTSCRVEISTNFEGKRNFDPTRMPPCPDHS